MMHSCLLDSISLRRLCGWLCVNVKCMSGWKETECEWNFTKRDAVKEHLGVRLCGMRILHIVRHGHELFVRQSLRRL